MGARMIVKGEQMVHRGEKDKESGEAILSSIEGYDPGGNHRINVGQLGTSKVKELMQDIDDGERMKDDGGRMAKDGEEMKERGKDLMPGIAQTPHMLSYFNKLYKLAQTATTLKSVGLGNE